MKKKTNKEEVAEATNQTETEEAVETNQPPIDPNKPIEQTETKPYFNYEYMRNHGKNANVSEPVLPCKECECEWFEYIKVQQVSKKYSVGPGQEPQQVPVEGSRQILIFKCFNCGHLQLPKLNNVGSFGLMTKYGEIIALVKKLNEA